MTNFDDSNPKTLLMEMISISTKCLLSDPDNFVCICYIPVLFEFNKILFTPNTIDSSYFHIYEQNEFHAQLS